MKFVVPFEITGDVEVEANDAEHAQEIAYGMTIDDFVPHGELWTGVPFIPLNVDKKPAIAK